jgi:hypothetical protein
MERYLAKMNLCFARKARQIDALRQPALAFAENRNAEVRALSIIGPASGKAPQQGKSPRKVLVPLTLDRF